MNISSNKPVLNRFDEEEEQRILENPFIDPLCFVKTSERGNYIITAVNPVQAEPSCGIAIYDGSS